MMIAITTMATMIQTIGLSMALPPWSWPLVDLTAGHKAAQAERDGLHRLRSTPELPRQRRSA
jgi:hypothetical protein